jgi:hypothetical protein
VAIWATAPDQTVIGGDFELSAADFSRWEAKATHDLFWPMRFALIDGGAGGAVARSQCVGKVFGRPAAFADGDQRAHHRAHLGVQERARGGFDAQLLIDAHQVEAVERLDRRLGLALGVAEGGEVVPADQALGGGVHRRMVERARHAPGAGARDREVGTAVDDAVAVVALDRREARVERLRHHFGCEHRDRVRAQMRGHGVAHGVGVPALGKIDMGHLTERMHAGVSPPGPTDLDALAAERLDRCRQQALYRQAGVLHLPTHEWGTIIFDQELVTGHGRLNRAACQARAACRAGTRLPSSPGAPLAAIREGARRRPRRSTSGISRR